MSVRAQAGSWGELGVPSHPSQEPWRVRACTLEQTKSREVLWPLRSLLWGEGVRSGLGLG